MPRRSRRFGATLASGWATCSTGTTMSPKRADAWRVMRWTCPAGQSAGQPRAWSTSRTSTGKDGVELRGVSRSRSGRRKEARVVRRRTAKRTGGRRRRPEKSAKGLWDIRDPEVRAQRCASCHVGNAAEGKFVTHAMYAAGHPPLPPLEVMTFSRDQPMHYKPPHETDVHHWSVGRRRLEAVPFPQGRVGVSPASGGRGGGRLPRGDEDAGPRSREGRQAGGGILDFALLRLRRVPPRPGVAELAAGGLRGTPGRPLPRTGPTAVLRTFASEAGGFDDKFAALRKACDAPAFR